MTQTERRRGSADRINAERHTRDRGAKGYTLHMATHATGIISLHCIVDAFVHNHVDMDTPYPAACARQIHIICAVHSARCKNLSGTMRMERSERATPAWLTERVFGYQKLVWLAKHIVLVCNIFAFVNQNALNNSF